MPDSTTSVVPLGDKVCTPFLLDVMIFSPEAGFKFKVVVERSCTPDADEIWKIVFDLFKVSPQGVATQVVHVSYTTGTPVERKAAETMVALGVNAKQADGFVKKVFPSTKKVIGVDAPTAAQKAAVHNAMKSVVNLDV